MRLTFPILLAGNCVHVTRSENKMADVEAMETDAETIDNSSKESSMEVDKPKEKKTINEAAVSKSVAGPSKSKGFELPW